MPELIINGPLGRIEARYKPGIDPTAPLALILHPHPEHGGTMNNRVVYQMFQAFAQRGFTTMRFNFPGVGRSEGLFDGGEDELSVAASVLDYMQNINPHFRSCWVAGFSFGSWIGMQLLMRRPEINGYVSVSPPANLFDFSFLAPCPASGMIVMGDRDEVVPLESVDNLISKITRQKGVSVDYRVIEGANHFFDAKTDELMVHVNDYIDGILGERPLAEAA
ncbi:MAG: alpha/beta hydrolase [Alphaproteobacteria bacterium]|jgi:alpha/beta superfamily hydrolase|nr:alpha/beta hydrolase [Alphaproteobacteria bacterium]